MYSWELRRGDDDAWTAFFSSSVTRPRTKGQKATKAMKDAPTETRRAPLHPPLSPSIHKTSKSKTNEILVLHEPGVSPTLRWKSGQKEGFLGRQAS
ncbi:hypothetical protein ACLOJK_013352 [Asimina triloba]